MTTVKIGSAWKCSNIPKTIVDGIITCNKKEDVSMLIFICERCRANDKDLKDMRRDISDIKKELSKMSNDRYQNSHRIFLLKVPMNFNPNVVGEKGLFCKYYQKNQMPNLDSINENVFLKC